MAPTKKIIFVDDEPNVLNGLRRSLRGMRNQWEMAFVGGGREALEELKKKEYDVIVSDMQMSGMDGVHLLEKVRELYPHTIRIALSGQTSKDAVLRSVGPIHQYLPKPCDGRTLIKTIDHVSSLRKLINNEKLKDLVSQMESLPCMSYLHTELIAELNSCDADIKKVARIISQDVGMSVKVLQLVNSSFFGVRQYVSNIHQAVALLGLETIKSLVLMIKIFSQFESTPMDWFSLNDLWEHSFAVGEWASEIARAERLDEKLTDAALIGGVFHDIGKLVLACKAPQEYQPIVAIAVQEQLTLAEVEQRILGATHAEVGGYLLGLWGFSHEIILAVLCHHDVDMALTSPFSVNSAVYVANILGDEYVRSVQNVPQNNDREKAAFQEWAYAGRMDLWREKCPERLKTVVSK